MPGHSETDPQPASSDASAVSAIDRSRVTVVLPTFNRRESLCRCIRALLLCDTAGLEVTLRVMDDGSTDGSEEAVAAVASEYSGPIRIRYRRHENCGVAATRNAAIEDADTDLILFIDDDCVPDPGWIRGLVGAPWDAGVGAVGGRIISSAKGTWVSRYCRHIRFNEFPPDAKPIRFVNTANCAYRLSVLREAKGFETAVSGGGEDHELAWRVTLMGYRLVYAPEAVVDHHHRETLPLLLRTFWTRGYAGTLRDVLWRVQPAPTAAAIARERRRLAVDVLGITALPLKALKMARRGVPFPDCFRFAYVDWSRRIAQRRGKLEMLRRIASGEQSLDGMVTEAAAAPPPWARSTSV